VLRHWLFGVWWRLRRGRSKGTLESTGFPSPRDGGIAKEGATLRYARFMLVLAGLAALSLAALATMDGQAGAWSPHGFDGFVRPEPITTPVKIYKDCQQIALCTGCRPVYKCRSCNYQKVCSRGLCEWRDICVWGPYVKVLPPGARIIRIR